MVSKRNPPEDYPREPIGRPSKFTPERRASIIKAIASRVPYEMAAEAHGITVTTLYDWLLTGRKHSQEGLESDYTSFSEGVKKAEMERVVEHCNKISANIERWQGDAWMLERRWHKHFSSNVQLHELNERLDKLEGGNKNESRNEEEREKDGKECS